MRPYRLFFMAVVLTIATSAAFAQTASQSQQSRPQQWPPANDGKRLTYEEAWKRCTPYARQQSWDAETQRYLRAAACRKHFGHNI